MKRAAFLVTILCLLLALPLSAARLPVGFVDFRNPFLDVPGHADATTNFEARVYWWTGGAGGIVSTPVTLAGATLTVHFSDGPDVVSSDPTQPWAFPLDMDRATLLPGAMAGRTDPYRSQNIPGKDAQNNTRAITGITLAGTLQAPETWAYTMNGIAGIFRPQSTAFAYRINLAGGWANDLQILWVDGAGIPEPSGLLLAAAGLAVVFAARRTRKI